ncbi:MAG TPA: Gfo/Idh/MocA family oxidoreductase [Phycisphaerae bacterium]|nr:Gfo/Idh/MocA family oxidoreductase [Phycisphaerae bacterium]
MSKQYGFGVIGAGMIGNFHADAIKQLPNGKLVGICDTAPGAADKAAAKYGCEAGQDLEKFLSRKDIDVVTIATPSGTHAELAIAAARLGKHCIVEKPLDITLDKIDAAIAAHDKAGTKLGGVFNIRFLKTAQLFKQAVAEGRFGRMTYGMAYGPWWRDQAYYDNGGWRGTWKMDGGGALMNQGIHTIDLLQWLMGPVKRVQAMCSTLAHERIEVEDTGVATLEFASGALGTIACTTSMWPGHFRIVEVSGANGTVAMADQNFFFWQFRDEKPQDKEVREKYLEFPAVSMGASNPSAGMTADGHRDNFASFLKALDEGRRPEIDGLEARKAVQIILAVYESARTGKPVELK